MRTLRCLCSQRSISVLSYDGGEIMGEGFHIVQAQNKIEVVFITPMHQVLFVCGVMSVDRCINLRGGFEIQSFLTCNTINKMAEKEMALIERMRMAREVKALQVELGDCRMQLQFKDGKIQELQRMVVELQDREIEENIAVEEEIQCSLDRPSEKDQEELLTRLSSMLTQREEQGVGLHLATIQKDGQITALTAALTQAQELNNNLHQELAIQAAAIGDQEALIDSMKNQNLDLRERVAELQAALLERQAEVVALRESQQNLRILQEKRGTLQHIIIQNQKQRQEEATQEGKLMVALLEKEMGVLMQEKEKMKKTINNYQWKLFCLETQLDLSNKEKKQYKYVNDKHQSKIAELEANVKQMTIKIYSLEEQVKAIQEENRYYQTESEHKQRKIEELVSRVEQSSATGEMVKELQYRLREKDEQLTQIANYLKEKMKEHHETKLKCQHLEKSLADIHKKAEKAEYEVYQMEQCIIEHEEIMQRQTERIDQSSRETDFLNRKINELSLMNILRTQEFEEKVTALQNALKEKSAKVNQLSVEIIQREIECNKKLEEANQREKLKVNQMEQRCKDLTSNLAEAEGLVNRLASKLRESQEEIARLSDLANSKSCEISKIVGKMNTLQLAVKEKEKLVQFLQGEVKTAKAEFKEARLANRRLQEQMEQMREIIAVNEQKLKILKKEAVENIQSQLNNELQMEQLKRQLAKIDAERSQLSSARKYSEEALERAREVIEELQAASKLRLHQIVSQLTKPLPDPDDTATFEVLAEEQELQVVHESAHQKERKELLVLMGQYSRQVDEICLRLRRE